MGECCGNCAQPMDNETERLCGDCQESWLDELLKVAEETLVSFFEED